MPPKRKVPARRASIGKRVSFGGSSIISSPTTKLHTSLSGRPKRESTVGVDYKPPGLRRPNTFVKKLTNKKDAPPAPIAATPKKRGRPPKTESPTVTSPVKTAKTTAATPVKATRGRPKQSATAPTAASAARGRPKKAEVAAAPASLKKRKREEEESAAEPPKKRGRPPKTETATVAKPRKQLPVKVEKSAAKPTSSTKAKATPKKSTATEVKPAAKRGPKPKSAALPATSTKTTKAAATSEVKKAGGRPKGSKNKPKPADTDTEAKVFDDDLTPADIDDASDEQYWLMKAEPDTRIEKGVDVAYPIDKLAQAAEPEPWDGELVSHLLLVSLLISSLGVRNAVARNNMRAMRKGDLAFFYHSNCTEPGIVGVMRIAEEHAVDESAFDPEHPYYDEKSVREKPKWDCVKVEYVKKFAKPVSLKEVKSTPELSKMQLVSAARLSVQKVRPSEWRFVLKMADESEDLGVTSAVSGYEADTNGETDKDADKESIGLDEEDGDVDEDALAKYGKPDDPVVDEPLQEPNAASAIANGHTATVEDALIEENTTASAAGNA